MLKRLTLPFLLLVMVPLMGANGGCNSTASTDDIQAHQTEQMVAQANAETGMPAMINFQERKLVKMLYELRDQEGITTFTYYLDRNGQKHLLCESVGYGIPYAVQFSNPVKLERSYGPSEIPVPQPEPNGLFMPDALSATWIMCADGDGVRPVYVEPTIIVSPFRLEGAR